MKTLRTMKFELIVGFGCCVIIVLALCLRHQLKRSIMNASESTPPPAAVAQTATPVVKEITYNQPVTGRVHVKAQTAMTVTN